MNKEVGKTAHLIAQWRSEESKVPTPLFEDPYAVFFTSPESKRFAETVDRIIPSIREMARLRTRYFDDALHQCAIKGVQQLLILGTGFDMRAHRFSHLGFKAFEVDQEPVITYKENILRRNGVPHSSILISGNYLAPSFFEKLKSEGFDDRQTTFILLEGNTMYLPKPDLHDFLARIKTRLSKFYLSFDYVTESVVQKRTGFEGLTRFAQLFEAQGALLRLGIDDILSFAKEAGFRLIENFTQFELRQRYAPQLAVDQKLFEVYSTCLMESCD
jgi:methyltransferase (TIGR00027 family)